MTQDKAFKAAVRARMAQAGEPYSVARRTLMSDAGDASEPAAEPDSSAHVTSDRGETEDYNERYAREARLAGLPEEEIAVRLAGMTARDQSRGLATEARALADRAEEAAERAQERADEAEEEAARAEERAELAREAAEMAHEWAEEDDLNRAQERAGQMQQRAEQARESADQAQEAADRAQDRADRLSEAADEAEEADDDYDEDQDEGWQAGARVLFPGPAPRSLRPPRPPRPPRPHRPPPASGSWGGPDRLISELGRLQERFEQAQERLQERIEQAQERAAEVLGQFGTDRDRG
jgi:hypothetical protein